MNSCKIIFLARNTLLDTYISTVARRWRVFIFQRRDRRMPDLNGAEPLYARFYTFGILTIARLLHLETTTPAFVLGFKRFMREVQPTHIVCPELYRGFLFQALKYVRRNPEVRLFIYTETKALPQNFFARCAMKMLLRYVACQANYVEAIFTYTNDGKFFLSNIFTNTPIKVMPIPVDTKIFKPSDMVHEQSIVQPHILMNARFVDYKNHRDLFDAVALLKKKSIDVHISCIGRSGHEREKLQRYTEKVGIADQVMWLDPVPQEELVEIYNTHDVLVLPSYNEAIGMVVPEAMACGIPTITSDTVGANVYVEDGETGIIFETGNVEALADAVKEMLDSAKRKRMGQAARKRIEENFTIEKVTKRFCDSIVLYETKEEKDAITQ